MATEKGFPFLSKSVFQTLADHPALTRAELAERLAISPSNARYLTENLLQYGLLAESLSSGEMGRPACRYSVRCSTIFRVLDLSFPDFSISDYSAEGHLLKKTEYAYRESFPFRENLALFLARCGGSEGKGNFPLFSGVLLPAPEEFLIPGAERKVRIPDPCQIQKQITQQMKAPVVFAVDLVTATANEIAAITENNGTTLALFLHEVAFSVFCPAGGTAVVRPLTACLDKNFLPERVAASVIDMLYLSGAGNVVLSAQPSYDAVTDMVRAKLPSLPFPPAERTARLSFPHESLLRDMRGYWFDYMAAELKKRFSKN